MWDIILLFIMILLSGFFSGIEIAFMSLSNLRVSFLVNNNIKNAKLLQKLKKDPQKLLILILIGNNIVNISASAIATNLAIKTFGSMGVGIATGIMTLIILIFGEITPKAYCTYNAEKVALRVSPFINLFSKILYPLVEVFNSITKMITNIFGKTSKKPLITEDEVRNIVNLGEEEGSIKSSEREMINNIFRFDDITVGSIMVPRPNIFALEENLTTKEITSLVIEEGFSRVPLYNQEIDKITGILFIRDLIKASPNQQIKHFSRPVLFVPETKKINSLFNEMNIKKNHIAIVIDEHGTVMGLVTIEDLIEEIVGEIYDETDEIKLQFKKVNNSTYFVDGDTEIKKVNKKLNLNIHGNVHKSISAFILDKLGRIPSKGEKINLHGCVVSIEDVIDNKIENVKIKLKK